MLGSNVSTVGGLPNAFVQARAWQCEAIQVYVSPSRTWNVPPLRGELITSFRAEREDSPVRAIIAHVPFLVNLAAPTREARRRSIERLAVEIERADSLGVTAVVLHPGSATDGRRLEGISRIARGLGEVLARTEGLAPSVLLENMAGQGHTIGGRFQELRDILGEVRGGSTFRLGVCFDTAHAFIAGYPLVGEDGYREVIDLFDQIVGVGCIEALHLNDAASAHGSRYDRHAPIGEGSMGLGVFHAVMHDPLFRERPRVVEIPTRDKDSLRSLTILRDLERQPEFRGNNVGQASIQTRIEL